MADTDTKAEAQGPAPEILTDIEFTETNRIRVENEARARDQLGALKKKVSRSLDTAFGPAVDRHVA